MARRVERYPYLDDVDFVKINVKGDGSCFYRALYTAAANYPIADPEIAPNLLHEFNGIDNLLTVVLAAFNLPVQPEDEAVVAIRNKIALGVTNVSDNAAFNDICRAHYLEILNTLRNAYREGSRDSERVLYNQYLDAAAQEFKKIFSTSQYIRSHLLGDGVKARQYLAAYQAAYNELFEADLHEHINNNNYVPDDNGIKIRLENDKRYGYKQWVIAALQKDPEEYFFSEIAEIISNIKTYASDSDITLVQNILAMHNITVQTTSLETIDKAQRFSIINDGSPILRVDRVGQIHYHALIPFEVYDAKVKSNHASPLLAKVATYGIPKKPIKYSRCTYKKRKARGLKGGMRKVSRSLKRRRRN
jgi:hypothetical protein